MIVVMLLMLVAGIGFAQAVSDPKQVTLRWLRLGGIIAAALLAVSVAVAIKTKHSTRTEFWVLIAAMMACIAGQIITVQLAQRRVQQLCAMGLVVLGVSTLALAVPSSYETLIAMAFSSILLGGFLMTMLLGHAYLTAGNEMTQKPFRRLVLVLAGVLILRVLGSVVFALLPWWRQEQHTSWAVMLVTTRYLVGMGVPAAFLYMIHDCVKRHANQSATGILYVALILIVLGEGTALALMSETGLAF